MTRTGNGKVSCGIRSAWPSRAKASISSRTVAPMIASFHWSRTRARKALATRARWLAPRWLSLLWRLPLVDRFAYPQLVARGQGYLAVHDPAVFDAQDALARGWKILPEGYEPPRSRAPLTGPEGPAH